MQQFVVPQFIDVETKIFGPITVRQFLILLAGGLTCFLAFRYGDLALFATVLAVVGGLSLTFAFVKVKGQDFHYFLLNVFQTAKKPSLRIWRKDYSNKDLDYLRKKAPEIKEIEQIPVKRAKRKRIQDLSLIVNTGGYYQGEE